MKLPKTESVGVNDASAQRMLPPCVLLRRRFIRRFLYIGAALSLVGVMAHVGYFDSFDRFSFWMQLEDYWGTYLWIVLPVFACLFLPGRTKRGTLLQLVGLVLPLLVTIYVCCMGWNSTPDSSDAFAYVGCMFLLCWGGIVCFYLPGVLLNYTLFFIGKRRAAKK